MKCLNRASFYQYHTIYLKKDITTTMQATLIGNKVYIFGGEDPRRKLFNELWTLDLTTLEWAQPDTTGPAPCPRSAHTAVQYRNRHIVIFGGGSVATCYDDLFVFDTQTLTWSKPEVEGPVPTPRAGHAAAVLGQVMLVVGGGNNNAGCADMYTMDLSGLDRGILTVSEYWCVVFWVRVFGFKKQ